MLIVIFWALVAFAAGATVFLARRIKDRAHLKTPKGILSATIIVIIWCALSFSGTQLIIAAKHGCDDWNRPFTEILEYNRVTPYADALPTDLTNKIVVLFRYDCPDCHAIYPELEKFLENDDVYAVSSRTEDGHALCELYLIEDVPTAIYFAPDATGAHDTKKQLYTVNENGDVVFDEANAQRLLDLRSEGE